MKTLTWKKQICEVRILDIDATVVVPDEKQNTESADTAAAVILAPKTDVSFERAVWPSEYQIEFDVWFPTCA